MEEKIDLVPQDRVDEEQEIDFALVFRRLWSKRRFIIKIAGIITIIGLFLAIFTAKEYTAGCTLVPQSGGDKKGGMGSLLSSITGMSLDNTMADGTIMPVVYPKIIENVEFRKELMYTTVKLDNYPEPVTVIDYFTNPDYGKFNLIDFLKGYTIGLPGKIISAIRKNNNSEGTSENNLPKGIETLTEEEKQCSKALAKSISLEIVEKQGYINITANMREPLAAAQLAKSTFELLQKYITKFKLEKAADNQKYIQERFDDAKTLFEAKQLEYAKFKDANRVISTETAKIEDRRLQNEYNMAYTLYSQLQTQLIQADLKLKEDTPILTVIKPIVIPTEKTKPHRVKMLVMSVFVGLVIGIGVVLLLDWVVKNLRVPIKNWEVPDLQQDNNFTAEKNFTKC